MRARPFKTAAIAAVSALLAGFTDIQSTLAPRGPAAADLALLGWVLFAGAAVIFVVVMVLLGLSLRYRRTEGGEPHRRNRWLVVGGGILFPTVTLAALLVWTSWLSAGLRPPAETAQLIVRVTGYQWWWEMTYLTPEGEIVTANELRLPVDRPVLVQLTTEDVIHSFWVPTLHGKLDLIPGRVNQYVITASEVASLRGQCAEYCGLQHANMAFSVETMPPDAFDVWLALQASPIEPPRLPHLQAGMRAFLEVGCGGCHAVRGAEWNGIVADGQIGPDLTHIGSRRYLAAGTLGNGVGPLAAWIASSQHLKPGNRMPSFDRLDGPTLRAIAVWLETLK